MGFSLSPDLSARDSNIGPRACPRSDIGRGLIDLVMTKTPCYDLFIITDSAKKISTESTCQYFFESGGNLLPRLKTIRLTGNRGNTKGRTREGDSSI